MNGNEGLIGLLQDMARTPTVERIEVSGDSADPRITRRFYAIYLPQQILAGNVSIPDLQVAYIVVIGTVRNVNPPWTLNVPGELDRLREQTGLPPLPFHWECSNADPSPNGVTYKCRPGDSRA